MTRNTGTIPLRIIRQKQRIIGGLAGALARQRGWRNPTKPNLSGNGIASSVPYQLQLDAGPSEPIIYAATGSNISATYSNWIFLPLPFETQPNFTANLYLNGVLQPGAASASISGYNENYQLQEFGLLEVSATLQTNQVYQLEVLWNLPDGRNAIAMTQHLLATTDPVLPISSTVPPKNFNVLFNANTGFLTPIEGVQGYDRWMEIPAGLETSFSLGNGTEPWTYTSNTWNCQTSIGTADGVAQTAIGSTTAIQYGQGIILGMSGFTSSISAYMTSKGNLNLNPLMFQSTGINTGSHDYIFMGSLN
jgi:hypothetical protein